jgi:hypothetical protein
MEDIGTADSDPRVRASIAIGKFEEPTTVETCETQSETHKVAHPFEIFFANKNEGFFNEILKTSTPSKKIAFLRTEEKRFLS